MEENICHCISACVTQMQIKTTLKFYLPPVRIAMVRNIDNKCWPGCGGKEPSYAADGNINKYNHCEQQYGGSSEN
jgi:hypothetical protein